MPAEQGDELNNVLTSRPLRTALRVPELRLAGMLSAMVRLSLPVVDPEATDMRTVGLVTGAVDCAQRASGRAMTAISPARWLARATRYFLTMPFIILLGGNQIGIFRLRLAF